MIQVANERYLSLRFDCLTLQKLLAAPAFFRVILCAVAIATFTLGLSHPAQALPSFARQTGQPCGTCHTDYPGLTPYGRLFKLNGYTAGGGPFRKTLFPSQDDATKALAAYAKKFGTGKDADAVMSGQSDTSNIWVPPISMMAIVGYTHTQADQSPSAPFHANDNVVVAPLSFFYGGAITDHIGAFAQVTYNNATFGNGATPPTDPCWNCEWSWDNIDVRYANIGKLGNMDVIYGISANNNPSVQDPWNTTPAWGFPYSGSTVAPGPAAATLIDGTYAATVGGVGGYVFINNLVYLELTGYRTLDFKTLPKLGVDPFGVSGLFNGVAPYWRAAVEPHWGNHWFEFGTFGMSAQVRPWTQAADPNTGFLLSQVTPQTDRFTDIGLDSQYQYQGPNYWITLRGTYIHENQQLNASVNNGLSSNPSNTLNTLRAYASLAYGNDNRIVLTGQYFNTWGTSDATLYGSLISCTAPNTACSPDSNGFIAEISYIPFSASQAPGWPWANVRISLQYTYYNKFDGDTVNAHNNNTLFLHAWFAL
jgi:hypothetical protein